MKKRIAKKIQKNPARYHPHQIVKAENKLKPKSDVILMYDMDISKILEDIISDQILEENNA